MDTRMKIYFLTGLLLALTCPTNCDGDASSATPSTTVQESTRDPQQSDSSTSSTMALESTGNNLQGDSSASSMTVQASTNADTESDPSPTVLVATTPQLPTTTMTTTTATTTSVSEVPNTTTLASDGETSQDAQEGGSGERDVSTTSAVNLLPGGAGSTVGSTTSERLPGTSVARAFSTTAGTTERSSTSTVAITSTEATTPDAVTTPATLPETSTTLHEETTPHQSTANTTNRISIEPTDGSGPSTSHGSESTALSSSPIPANQQSSTAPAELTTSPYSSVTSSTPDVTNPGGNGTTFPSGNYTSESPHSEPSEGSKSEPSTGKTGSSECSYHHFMVSVVLSVLFINLVFCALSSFCVYRIVTKHHFYSWDPPPIRYGSVDYGISMGRRNMGLDLSPETPDGIPPPSRTTHEQLQLKNRDSGIPIVITNEDGWCVPYSEDSGVTRVAGEHGQEGTSKTNGNASNRADVDTGL